MPRKHGKWVRVVEICARLRLGGSATLSPDCESAVYANRLRGILHSYRDTHLSKFTVRRVGGLITVTRVGTWEGIQK
jgi:hypothetical protein